MFHWQDDPSKIQQGRKSGKWLKVEILAVKGPMAVVSTEATIHQLKSELRRLYYTVDLEELPDSRERTGAPVLWHSCEGQMDVWEMCSVKQTEKTFGHWIWKNLRIRVSGQEHQFCGFLVKVK